MANVNGATPVFSPWVIAKSKQPASTLPHRKAGLRPFSAPLTGRLATVGRLHPFAPIVILFIGFFIIEIRSGECPSPADCRS
jgi:hypothetical protein